MKKEKNNRVASNNKERITKQGCTKGFADCDPFSCSCFDSNIREAMGPIPEDCIHWGTITKFIVPVELEIWATDGKNASKIAKEALAEAGISV